LKGEKGTFHFREDSRNPGKRVIFSLEKGDVLLGRKGEAAVPWVGEEDQLPSK